LLVAAGVDQQNSADAAKQPAHAGGNEWIGMKHELDLGTLGGKLGQRRGDRGESFAPTFAPMTGDQEPRASAVAKRRRRQSRSGVEQGVDAAVARDVNF